MNNSGIMEKRDRREKIKVAVLGASGMVGQVFTWMLSDHKEFEIVCLAGSEKRQGNIYGEEVNWQLPYSLPPSVSRIRLSAYKVDELKDRGVEIVFSALPADVGRVIEPTLASAGYRVFSNSSAMRYEPDVPILIREVNPEAIARIERQHYSESGFIVANPNCTTSGLAISLAPVKIFGIEEVFVSTYQAISGAGYPGVPALDIEGNVMPMIEDEEEKISRETKEILGIDVPVRVTAVRVPTRFGHLGSVWVRFSENPSVDEIAAAWDKESDSMVTFLGHKGVPTPAMAFYGNPVGMTVLTGRLRDCRGMTGFVFMVNNLVRGAAGGSISNAEYFLSKYADRIGSVGQGGEKA